MYTKEQLHKMCTGKKRRYDTKQEAKYAAQCIYSRLKKKDPEAAKKLSPYKCPACGLWHLTTHAKQCRARKKYYVQKEN